MTSANFRYMIDQCEGNEEKLSARDIEFLEIIHEQLDINGYLTEPQAEHLERIYQRVT